MASFGFTRASEQDIFRIDSHQPNQAPSIPITGQEARQFYESLVNDEKATKKEKIRRRKKRTTRQELRNSSGRERTVNGESVSGQRGGGGEEERADGERRGELQGLRLLRCAHEGDTLAIKDLLGKGADIDFQRSPSTALRRVRDVLQRPAHRSPHLHPAPVQPAPPPSRPALLPAPSSTSYRMMLRSGWDPGSGLGPEGTGTRRPVPTVLKRDTQGLGYGRGKKPKVTHFKAMDTEAVQRDERRREMMEERRNRGERREEMRRKELRTRPGRETSGGTSICRTKNIILKD
ncbi:hypothetical protein WMY93_005469 [Mugilogobius chulae]|uniref:G-patch domain-containing protein n=1 Tax=Mugilogobius chulae TaxID=88201 RepID=A0AAW0PR18_9GOBI